MAGVLFCARGGRHSVRVVTVTVWVAGTGTMVLTMNTTASSAEVVMVTGIMVLKTAEAATGNVAGTVVAATGTMTVIIATVGIERLPASRV